VRGLVGEECDTPQGTHETQPVDQQLVGVVLGNDGLVVGVFSVDQAACQHDVVRFETRVGAVEGDGYVGGQSRENVFEDVQRFFGHDEFHRDRAGDVFTDVFDQFVCIGSHEHQAFRGELEQDARHHGTHVVVASGEDRFLDGRS